MSTQPLTAILACLAILTLGCEQEETAGIWVTIDPIQCLSNAWEQDWLLTHDNDYDAYPRDEEGRLHIFYEFFEAQGVTIHEVKVTIWAEVVCDACSCPTGERIHCLIDEGDLPVMREWGFREET